ncbi:MAG: hypothetical protein ABH845_03015 [Candidatus Omnitrophota bacterium]
MRYASLMVVILLGFTFGCGPMLVEGNKIDTAKMRELIKGQSTKAEVFQKLGQPAKVEKLPSGEEKFSYNYYYEEYTHWWTLPRIYKQDLEVYVKGDIFQNYIYTRELRDVPTDKDE